MAAPEVTDALANIQLFRGIAPRGLETLAAITREQSYGKGEFVFREGAPGTSLYLLLSGKVRISKNVAGMGEEALAVLGPGDVFGEMSIIDDSPRSADAIVHETCRLLVLEKEPLEDLMFLHKDIAYEMLWNVVRTLSSRLRETNDKMTFMSTTGKF